MGGVQEKILFSANQLANMIRNLARAIVDRHSSLERVVLIGIRRGGDHLARRLQAELKILSGMIPEVGIIDVNFYRDDWSQVHIYPKIGSTSINFSLGDRVVVLVDDVLYTGRTIRAALNELIDFGRPRRIELATLIDRGHRELPIQADYVGVALTARPEEIIEVKLVEDGAGRDQILSYKRFSNS